MEPNAELTELTVRIVSAFVANNPLEADGLSALIRMVYAALLSVAVDGVLGAPGTAAPAVSVKRSVTPDYLICLEDGLRFKSLKRHLWTHFQLTPEAYRAKWGLPRDYPMVAPNYAQTRSKLAKQMGLGNRPRSTGRPRGNAGRRRAALAK
jgi:predicted transcriptional regulator